MNISQQYGKLSITTTPADMGLTTTQPQLSIETEAARVEISQPKGELEIDWEPFRASFGIKTYSVFVRDCAELGRQTALDTIEQIAQEGDRLASIESQEDAVAAMAAESTLEPPLEITWAWLEPPVIHYTAHQPEFNPIPGHVNIEVKPGKVDMNFKPGRVDIRMAQYPSIKMWATDSSVDIRV